MPHAKFQKHRPSSSGEDFQRFLLFIAMVAINISFVFPILLHNEFHLKNQIYTS